MGFLYTYPVAILAILITNSSTLFMPFSSLGLHESLLKILSNQKYDKPTPIQEQTIPIILKGDDLLGIARTGSGKTASFVLPILTNLLSKPAPKNRHVQVLVLVPTRELAVQVKDVFQQFGSTLPQRVKTLAVFGGVSINPQMMALQGVHILVATPGRLIDLIESKAVHLSKVQTLVLDEADKMLNMGFKEEVDKLLALLPKKRQNLLFSATLNEDVEHVQKLVLTAPSIIKIEPETTNELELIEQIAYSVTEEKKGPLLRYLIKKDNLKQVLIFTSSGKKADGVVHKLQKNGIDARSIHGKKSMHQRTVALNMFKIGHLKVLVTTDLLSRGIDVLHLPHVINYELPRSPKDYVHRIGRTGRSESTGEAISLISPEEEHHFNVIQKKIGKKIALVDSEEFDLHGF